MKKVFIALFLVIVCLFSVSCGDSDKVDVPDGMKLASGEDDRYYLFVPSSWTVDSGYGNPYAYYSASDASNVTVNFYMTSSETDQTGAVSEDTENTTEAASTTTASNANPREKYINAYWDEFVSSMETTTADFTVIETIETTLDDIYAKQYIYSFKIDQTVYKCRMVVTYPAQDLIFCLTYTSLPDNFDKHTTEIDKVISEFKFNF